jgi:hypothetical protein
MTRCFLGDAPLGTNDEVETLPIGRRLAFDAARGRRWVVCAACGSIERTLVTVHPEARLALEMALHEQEERRALRGELTILRWAWQREERLAAIADGMLAPGHALPKVPW